MVYSSYDSMYDSMYDHINYGLYLLTVVKMFLFPLTLENGYADLKKMFQLTNLKMILMFIVFDVLWILLKHREDIVVFDWSSNFEIIYLLSSFVLSIIFFNHRFCKNISKRKLFVCLLSLIFGIYLLINNLYTLYDEFNDYSLSLLILIILLCLGLIIECKSIINKIWVNVSNKESNGILSKNPDAVSNKESIGMLSKNPGDVCNEDSDDRDAKCGDKSCYEIIHELMNMSEIDCKLVLKSSQFLLILEIFRYFLNDKDDVKIVEDIVNGLKKMFERLQNENVWKSTLRQYKGALTDIEKNILKCKYDKLQVIRFIVIIKKAYAEKFESLRMRLSIDPSKSIEELLKDASITKELEDIDSQLKVKYKEEYKLLESCKESRFSVVESILLSDCVLYDWFYFSVISKSLQKDPELLKIFRSLYNSHKVKNQKLKEVIKYLKSHFNDLQDECAWEGFLKLFRNQMVSIICSVTIGELQDFKDVWGQIELKIKNINRSELDDEVRWLLGEPEIHSMMYNLHNIIKEQFPFECSVIKRKAYGLCVDPSFILRRVVRRLIKERWESKYF